MKIILQKIRRVFLTGLLVSLPLIITIVVFRFAFTALDNFLGPLVTKLLIAIGVPIGKTYQIPGIGVVTTLVLVFLIGLFTRNFVGKRLWALGEWVVHQIPIIRSVYIGVKQIIDTFAVGGSQNFSKVVLVEYPRKDLYCLAFITGRSTGEAPARIGRGLTNIFLPTTPNPTSGFFLLVPNEDLIELDMSVEDGIKMIVSGGLVTPEFNGKVEAKSKPKPQPQGVKQT